ncbi:MAG: nucleotidyl transferase AbiEii/AbiGii toxin family protein [Candidatus Methanoperedens sp.]|nr:nucleotidyl transferase AbiEii/AbiGii toxin family protein [Candidatus Methanoperedens sp.]
MIRDIEIKEKARENGVPETTIEKDYALNWILRSLNQQTDSFVLKGGTGLRKVYFKNYRFSEDLDFTMLKSTGRSDIELVIKKAIQTAKRDSGINFHDNIESEENINGYKIDIYFRIFRRGGNPLRIKFDITKPENETIILPPIMKDIFHPYSDDYYSIACVYSIHEIMAEKIRSLFERTRARDVYDIWFISKNIDMEQVFEIFPAKCAFKKIMPDFEDLLDRKKDFQNAWKSSLGHQLKALPDFESVFNEVTDLMSNIRRKG